MASEYSNTSYDQIERPYDSLLNREQFGGISTDVVAGSSETSTTPDGSSGSTGVSGGTSGQSALNQNQETPVRSANNLTDLWIETFIKSKNWSPRVKGFYIDGLTGYAEFSNVFINGHLDALSGTIGGWEINPTTLSSAGIILDSYNSKLESTNYVSGILGTGFHLDQNLLEVGNIAARGLIRSAVFQKDVISSVGGNLVVLDSDVLDEDMDTLD